MDFVKSTTRVLSGLVLIGIASVFVARLLPQGGATEEGAAVPGKLAELERRVSRLERSLSDFVTPSRAGTSEEIEQLREEIARLQAHVASLSQPRVSPAFSGSQGPRAAEPPGAARSSRSAGQRSPEARLELHQLERVVAEVVASLAPAYLAEQVHQLYAAQKKADEETQREAEQRRAQESRERRLAQLGTDLQTFVPGLRPWQVDQVAQVISAQWDAMAAMRQQARENGTRTGPGEILRRAREMTDEQLEAILSPPQLEAFRLWRETRFGTPESMVR